MRTIRTKVYQFSELSKSAKQTAIEWWKQGETFDYIYEEAWESLKKFCEVFNIDMRDYDFNEPYRSHYSFSHEDNILELSGQRLATYIWNNYKSDIYKGKYFKSWTSTERVIHRNVKSTLKSKKTGWRDESKHGEYWNVYHSSITLEETCVFTGVCYDMDLLDPIYKFMRKPSDRIDFKDLLEDCLMSLTKSVEDEIRASSNDENVSETIIANEYEFTHDGKLFHS